MKVDYVTIRAWLEAKGFAFNRPFRSKGGAYTFMGQFVAYHENEAKDYFKCLETWLSYELGIHWYMILRNQFAERHQIWWITDEENLKQIFTAWQYWNAIAEEKSK